MVSALVIHRRLRCCDRSRTVLGARSVNGVVLHFCAVRTHVARAANKKDEDRWQHQHRCKHNTWPTARASHLDQRCSPPTRHAHPLRACHAPELVAVLVCVAAAVVGARLVPVPRHNTGRVPVVGRHRGGAVLIGCAVARLGTRARDGVHLDVHAVVASVALIVTATDNKSKTASNVSTCTCGAASTATTAMPEAKPAVSRRHVRVAVASDPAAAVVSALERR